MLDGADGVVGDGGDAFGAFAQDAGEVGRVGGDFAVALLEGLQVGDHHLGHLLLQIAIAHAGEVALHCVVGLAGEGLVDGEQIEHAGSGGLEIDGGIGIGGGAHDGLADLGGGIEQGDGVIRRRWRICSSSGWGRRGP